MSILTGSDGALKFQGRRIAKVRSFSVDIDRELLDTTGIGEWDRTYTKGLRDKSGQAAILYDNSDSSLTALFNSIFDDTETTDQIDLVLSTREGLVFSGSVLLSRVGIPVSVGEVTAVSVSFKFTGDDGGINQ